MVLLGIGNVFQFGFGVGPTSLTPRGVQDGDAIAALQNAIKVRNFRKKTREQRKKKYCFAP
jgi:hypothetical protein